MSKNLFNAVVILDAIPAGESNTARRLKEELDDIASYVMPGLQVLFARIETMSDLENEISNLLIQNRSTGLQPLLHLEGHGLTDESGFVTANGTPCSWETLKTLITPLNTAMGLNLMLIMATCFGGSFATAINTTDQAPVWGLIGPTEKITARQVETSFQIFYKTLFNSLSASEAIKALNDSTPGVVYFKTSAEQFFCEVWRGYKKNMCTEEMIEKLATRMHHEALSKRWHNIPSIEQFKQLISNRKEEKKLFEKYRDTFFIYDLFPSNRNRFPVTYEEAEEHVVN